MATGVFISCIRSHSLLFPSSPQDSCWHCFLRASRLTSHQTQGISLLPMAASNHPNSSRFSTSSSAVMLPLSNPSSTTATSTSLTDGYVVKGKSLLVSWWLRVMLNLSSRKSSASIHAATLSRLIVFGRPMDWHERSWYRSVDRSDLTFWIPLRRFLMLG